MINLRKSGVVLMVSTALILISTEILIPVVAQSPVINKVKQQQRRNSGYGLGLPKTASTGGSVRLIDAAVPGLESSSKLATIPQLTLLVPADGARTIASRPTFYWYIFGKQLNYKATFYLYESEGSQPLFQIESTIANGGVYKLVLPESAPALEVGKVRRWTVRLQTSDQKILEGSGLIALTNPPADLVKAKTELEQARIYVSQGYWYDALNSYSNWIAANPKDQAAIAERTDMLKEVLKDSKEFSTSTLIKRVNGTVAQELVK